MQEPKKDNDSDAKKLYQAWLVVMDAHDVCLEWSDLREEDRDPFRRMAELMATVRIECPRGGECGK